VHTRNKPALQELVKQIDVNTSEQLLEIVFAHEEMIRERDLVSRWAKRGIVIRALALAGVVVEWKTSG
jgi:hypothetical protein